ncbi:MAG: rod shape-determining protein MreC [Acidimicrobiales bacterium]
MVVLIVASLTIISVDLNGRTHSLTSGVKSVANGIFSPIRGGVVDILSPIGDFFAGSLHYGSLQTENEKLQATIGQLRMEQSEKGYESTQLRDLMALENLPFLPSLSTVTAQSVDQNSSNFTSTITIDKGRGSGVLVGMPVVGSGGLLGQVIQSFHSTAVVQLVNDGQSKVGVTFGTPGQCSGSQCIGTVDGQGPDKSMTLDLVPPNTPVQKGEQVVTSSLDAAAYPPGIPVATITSFRNPPGAIQEEITVTPEADLTQPVSYVDVVVWEPSP